MTDQLIPGDLLTRAKTISGLRALADYLEANPDLPVAPFGWDLNVYPARGDDEAAERAAVDQVAARLGVPVDDKTPTGGHYRAIRSFGLITYQAIHVPARRQAAHEALWSYAGCITPDETEVIQ